MSDNFQTSHLDQIGVEATAISLADLAVSGDVICLYGSYGSGKTTFARAFIRERAQAMIDVPSPSFALVQEYDFDHVALQHIDLDRIESKDAFTELDIPDIFARQITLIEWAEKLGDMLPERRIECHLAITQDYPEKRDVIIKQYGAWQWPISMIRL